MADGFSVDLGALEDAASGVSDTLDQFAAAPVDSLDARAADYGHDELAGTVKDFCVRWQLGVEHLAQDGREITQRLTQSVQDYLAVDKAAKGRLDAVFQRSTGPDPAAP